MQSPFSNYSGEQEQFNQLIHEDFHEEHNIHDSLISDYSYESETPPNSNCESLVCFTKSALNELTGAGLTVSTQLDSQTITALRAFQQSNNLPQTGKTDPQTERCLLELLARKRNQGSPEVLTFLDNAKTKIEDWSHKVVVNKPEIKNEYRDPRKVWALVLHQMAFKRKSKTYPKYSAPENYLTTGAHFCILFDGRIIQLHPMSRFIWHAQCISPRSVGVEFEGNFPNTKGTWWKDPKATYTNQDRPTEEQFQSGKFLARYLKLVLGLTHVLAHRQSSDSRENDPGPDIWYNVGEWAIANLGVTDGGTFQCESGKPILPEWKTWGSRTKTSTKANYNLEVQEMYANESSFESENPEQAYFEMDRLRNEVNFENENPFQPLSSESEEYDYFFNEEDLINDIQKAVSLNRIYAAQLGWDKFYDQINKLVLPYSGQYNISLNEESFAKAVEGWQKAQGFAMDQCNGIIDANTWARMKPFVTLPVLPAPYNPVSPVTILPDQSAATFNKVYAEKILAAMNGGFVGSTFNSKQQLESISKGQQVLNINPVQQKVTILPLIAHITEKAKNENYRDILIGSFIRPPSDGKCTGHCAGRCIDINYKGGSFELDGAVIMVAKILTYLLSLDVSYRKNIGFGLPLQGKFFGNVSLPKYNSTPVSGIIDPAIRQLIPQLGYVFPDNNNHLHIQISA